MTTNESVTSVPLTNTTSDEDRLATVSLRSMSLKTWRAARKQSIDKTITMTQYITSLIEKDISNQ